VILSRGNYFVRVSDIWAIELVLSLLNHELKFVARINARLECRTRKYYFIATQMGERLNARFRKAKKLRPARQS
jgi:hypothetical protein